MNDPNITMEEYIRLEEEKARKQGKVFNWETAKYGKIWYDEDIHELRSVETEFPAIAFNNGVSSEKHFLVNPRCFDDLNFFKDFENEFPAIVYNNAQMSKSDLLTESILSPQHIDEFDLNDETSVSEYDEEEQNVLYFNDLFPFNIIHPDDLKSEKDNDDNEVDIIQSSGDMALPPCDQRHQELSIIDMGKLVRLLICEEIDNTWAWVALGPERQPNAAAGAPGVAQDAPCLDEAGDRAFWHH
ncbi:hypothetical protein Tco_0863265 [Tanacetum coccineum]